MMGKVDLSIALTAIAKEAAMEAIKELCYLNNNKNSFKLNASAMYSDKEIRELIRDCDDRDLALARR